MKRRLPTEEEIRGYMVSRPGLADALATDHPFMAKMRASLNEWGHLTPNMERAVFNIAEAAKRRAAQPPPAPVVGAKCRTITGTVVSTKWKTYGETCRMYGRSVLKMLVITEAGEKVWGTVPGALTDDGYAHTPDGEPDLRGYKVSFEAEVEVSRNDPTFGFFKRPRNLRVVSRPDPVKTAA